jgi:low molecular weight protein-tyrosine phosphatase
VIFRRPQLRVLFVCTENICRSPMAEALARHHLKQRGLAKKVAVWSAGTQVSWPGRRPDVRVKRLLGQAEVPVGRIKARQVIANHVHRSDLVVVMEPTHMQWLQDNIGQEQGAEMRLLGAYGLDCSPDTAVPDPYYGSLEDFHGVLRQLTAAVVSLVDELELRLAVG